MIGACVGMGVAVLACAKDDYDDELADPTVRPTNDNIDRGREDSTGSLPRPSTSSSGGSKVKDGGPADDGGSSGAAPECADPDDAPEWIEDLAYPGDYIEVSSQDQATKELHGVVRDYYDYDYFAFDVYRNASGTVFPYNGEKQFPANTEICVFMECVDGEPTQFSCDAGTQEQDFSGYIGCCSVSSAVSMYYATCNGATGDDAWVYVRVTPNDENICSVPYTLRASFTH